MTLSGWHTAYCCLLFIAMIAALALYMTALAGKNWVEYEIADTGENWVEYENAGTKINEGMWIYCARRFTGHKCVMDMLD